MSTPNPTEFPDFPEVNHLGGLRDAIIRYRVGSYLYKVPAPYVIYWITPQDVAQEKPVRGIDFYFWMPSKQPTTDKGVPRPIFVDEEKFKAPGGTFTVQVLNFKILEPGKEYNDLVLPEQRQKNFLTSPRLVELGEHFGLLASLRGFDGEEPHRYYRNKPGDTPHFLLRASPESPNTIVPMMTGDVYFPDIKLSVFIKMSPRGISRWRETFQAIRDLGLSWIDATASPTPKN